MDHERRSCSQTSQGGLRTTSPTTHQVEQLNNVPNTQSTHSSASRFRVSQLISGKLTNASDESLGDIQDIVLAHDNRSIAYVVVAFGGFLGMGGKYFAMPWRLIKASRSNKDASPRLTLAVAQESLKAAPGFDKDEWPDMADTTWSRQVDTFYGGQGFPTYGEPTSSSRSGSPRAETRTGGGLSRDPNSDAFQHRRVSQLLGMDVVDPHNDVVAKVTDFVVNAERAQIEGAALSFGGLIGIGKQVGLVPIESLSLRQSSGTFSSTCTTADLEAMVLPGGEWPGLDSDDWLTRGRRQCGLVKNARADQSATANWGA